MKKGSGFTNSIPWLKQKQRNNDLELFLEALDKPALLINSASWVIVYANSPAIDFTQYTRSELIGLDLRNLFNNWDENLLVYRNRNPKNISPGQQKYLRLIRHNQLPVPIRVLYSQIPINDDDRLVILEEADIQSSKDKDEWDTTQTTILNELFDSTNIPDFTSALLQASSAVKKFALADQVIVYQLMGETPEIHQISNCGDQLLSIQQLDMHDLVSLNEARFWEPGKNPSCSLYRNARASGIRYLASAPIGQNNALIGLVVIVGKSTPPTKPVVDIARLLATVIGTIFQNNAQRKSNQEDLMLRSQIAARLSTIAEQVQEGVMQLSPSLHIRGINPILEEILGFSNREIKGQDVEKILIGNEKILHNLHQIIEGSSAINIGDVRLFRRDGQPFQAIVRIFPVINNGQLDEIEVFIQDMTEKEQIRAHAQELENRAWLGELMAVFAHEVRNPINNISTGLQLMSLHVKSDDNQQTAIGRMLQDCDRLEQLVKSVLGFSKPIEYQMEILDLGILLQRLFDRQRLKLTNPKIRLELQIDPQCPMISGHMRSLEQVFNNLITNAIQAMSEEEGVISIKIASGTIIEGIPYVDIFVADNGPGMPKDVQERIFQPFLTTKQNGTGLGLSIAKRIITAHKGNIQLTSFPGGTIFHIQLPAVEDETRKM